MNSGANTAKQYRESEKVKCPPVPAIRTEGSAACPERESATPNSGNSSTPKPTPSEGWTLRETYWVNCPVCGESDMEQELWGDELHPLIFCVNHACPSNVHSEKAECLSNQLAKLNHSLALAEQRATAAESQTLMDTECIERIRNEGVKMQIERDAALTDLSIARVELQAAKTNQQNLHLQLETMRGCKDAWTRRAEAAERELQAARAEPSAPGTDMIRLQCKSLEIIATHRRKQGDQTVFEDIIGAIKTIKALRSELDASKRDVAGSGAIPNVGLEACDERDETRRWIMEICLRVGAQCSYLSDLEGTPHEAWKGVFERTLAEVTSLRASLDTTKAALGEAQKALGLAHGERDGIKAANMLLAGERDDARSETRAAQSALATATAQLATARGALDKFRRHAEHVCNQYVAEWRLHNGEQGMPASVLCFDQALAEIDRLKA